MKTNFTLVFFLLVGMISATGQTLYCYNEVAASLNDIGEVHIDADMVIESYTGQIDSIVVTPPIATCDDIGTIIYQADAYVGGSIVTNCIGNILIEDKMAPIAIGETDVTVTLDSNGQYALSSEELDDGSWDNCSILSYAYSPATLDCDSANPTQVTLTVSDENQNSNSVMVNVHIDYGYIPTITCSDGVDINVIASPVTVTPEMILEGGPYPCINQYFTTCTDTDGNPVGCTFDDTQVGNSYIVQVTDFNTGNTCWSEVNIIAQEEPYGICVEDFEGGAVKDVEIVVGQITGDDGCTEIMSGPGAQISPMLLDDQTNGIDDIDLLLIREYILSIKPFKAEQLLAADANGNGGVTSLDLVLIQKALLGEYDFAQSWIFMDSEYDFQDNEMPTNFDQFITLGNEANYTFRGIKMGDVDLSYEQLVPDEEKESLTTTDIVLNKGEFYSIPVRMSELTNLVVSVFLLVVLTYHIHPISWESRIGLFCQFRQTDCCCT